jgi:hypothetical protein
MNVLSIILASSAASAASAVAAISRHVCKMISNRDKAQSLNHMTDILKDCPADECESVTKAIAKVADSLFPQPRLSLSDRLPRRRNGKTDHEPRV